MSQTFPPVRLAALDLDGTLLNHEGQVTPRTRAALQAASDRGVVIVPTTGRPLGNLPPVVAQLPGVRYAITSNGRRLCRNVPTGCPCRRTSPPQGRGHIQGWHQSYPGWPVPPPGRSVRCTGR